MTPSPETLHNLMGEALKEAKIAALSGEVPVGAVVAYEGEIIARAHNRTEDLGLATAHAETLAMELASRELGHWRLNKALLCVTLEPCAMCIGASRLARVSTIVFGAHDERMGACGSLFDISQDARLGSIPRVISGVRADECRALLQGFFSEIRSERIPVLQ